MCKSCPFSNVHAVFFKIRKWANSFYKKHFVQFQQCNIRKSPLSIITLKIFYIFTSLILLIFTAS